MGPIAERAPWLEAQTRGKFSVRSPLDYVRADGIFGVGIEIWECSPLRGYCYIGSLQTFRSLDDFKFNLITLL